MSRREFVIGAAMLLFGLVIGSLKGDDVIEMIQGVERTYVDIDNRQEIADKFNHSIRHHLDAMIPDSMRGKKLDTDLKLLNEGYHVDLYSEGELVATLDFDKDKKFVAGGWLIE